MIDVTALHDAHIQCGAKMGEFAGYNMPLYYGLGVKKEHEWVRENTGLFDVSHMGQVHIKGVGAQDFLEKLTPSSYTKQGINRAKYTVLTNENGGIIDDLMVTKTDEDEFHCVINAGCKGKDIAWIKENLPEGLEFKHYDDWALLALQGPKAESVIKDVLDIDLSDLPYMALWYQDYTMFISRLGYTGEDGFEISVSNADVPALWEKLLAHDDVKPIGLAARDSLRLEMGYCLYGHDIDATTSPLEADLGWVMGKDNTTFIGVDKIHHPPTKKRVGIELTGKGIAREGAEIRNAQGEKIGELTSGGFSPSLSKAIGQGYVPMEYAAKDTEILINIRGKDVEAKVTVMPFLPAKTKSMKSK
ncbi:MAG: glycine cleavage system aminomethyltransferase GcvT [Alphaproteobacteria bacterium]